MVVPLAAGLLFPNGLKFVVAVGAAVVGVEWALAYRSNQVEHGGDSQPGTELAVSTGFLALLLLAWWIALALIGVGIGRRWRGRR